MRNWLDLVVQQPSRQTTRRATGFLKPKRSSFPPSSSMPLASSSTGPIRTELSRRKRHRITLYFRGKGIRWDGSHEIPLEFPESLPFRSKSEEIDEEDVQYYHAERCAKAGEEYDSEFKWIKSESESEVNNDWSSGCSSGVLEGSSSKYTSPAIIHINFVHPSRGGFAPDVSGKFRLY